MYACLECGKKFKSTRAAERAVNEGCPKCGGSDIDLDVSTPKVKAERFSQAMRDADDESEDNLRCAADMFERLMGSSVAEVF